MKYKILFVLYIVIWTTSFGEFVSKPNDPNSTVFQDRITNFSESGTFSEEWVKLSTNLYVKRMDYRLMHIYGYMALGGQKFYIYDKGLGESDKLNIDFVDVNDDGYRDLVISGIVKNTTDNDCYDWECVVSVYICSPKINSFVLKYKRGLFDVGKEREKGANEALEQWAKLEKFGEWSAERCCQKTFPPDIEVYETYINGGEAGSGLNIQHSPEH